MSFVVSDLDRRVVRWMGIGAWLLAAGCGKPKEVGPAEHFDGVLDQLRVGSLAGAYEAFMPASYHRDLERSLQRAKDLVTEAEFQELRGFLEETGVKLAAALDARGGSFPLLAIVAKALRDVPELLGLQDYESFRARTVQGLLASIDEGLFRDLAASEAVSDRLAAATVSLRDTRGRWARLRFSLVEADGTLQAEDHEAIVVDGKWVPNTWAVEWPEVIRGWSEALDAWAREKAENPAILTDSLRTARSLAASADTLVLELLRRVGVSEADESPSRP